MRLSANSANCHSDRRLRPAPARSPALSLSPQYKAEKNPLVSGNSVRVFLLVIFFLVENVQMCISTAAVGDGGGGGCWDDVNNEKKINLETK